ncbi:hypothetical protein HGG75_28845 [Ochrobactrum pseudogrignonense]|nr:hypothetical protein [Brucella pseudogrignonensis]
MLDLGMEIGKPNDLVYEAVQIARRRNPHFLKIELHPPIERIILSLKGKVPQSVPRFSTCLRPLT